MKAGKGYLAFCKDKYNHVICFAVTPHVTLTPAYIAKTMNAGVLRNYSAKSDFSILQGIDFIATNPVIGSLKSRLVSSFTFPIFHAVGMYALPPPCGM